MQLNDDNVSAPGLCVIDAGLPVLASLRASSTGLVRRILPAVAD